MIFAHGQILPDSHLPQLLAGLEEEINITRATLTLSAETVISAIDGLGQKLDRGELDPLLAQFASPSMLRSLSEIRPVLTREALEGKLQTELGFDPARPQQRPFGQARILPLGTLFHVTAGNVAGLPAFSGVEGLLTGNINLIKLPRTDKGLTLAILSQLVAQEPRLAPFLYAFDIPSSDRSTLQTLANLADGLVVWGGDDAVNTCRALAPPGCKLMEWSHRLSFAYVSSYRGREEELSQLARHVIQTGGLLCSSCQVIYLDSDDPAVGEAFCTSFLPLLEQAAQTPVPGMAGQRTLYAYEAFLEHITYHPQRDARFFRGRGCSITLCRDDKLELSPLNGNVLVKLLPRARLLPVLRREKGRLQTAGLLCDPVDREELTGLLARAGLTRITHVGHMSHTFPRENHDGEYSLRRYIRIVDTET